MPGGAYGKPTYGLPTLRAVNVIIEESKEIKADRQKLKETEKIADKTKAEQIKQLSFENVRTLARYCAFMNLLIYMVSLKS